MHQASLDYMRLCYDRYVAGSPVEAAQHALIVDIGAMDINGSYRQLFQRPTFSYLGVDIEAGPGVDVVMSDPNRIPLADGLADIVVCGQMFEHCEFFWLMFAEMMRILKPDGYLFLIAPSDGPFHRHPVDCYRFYPDSYRALAKLADCRLVDLWWERSGWRDLVGVFQHHNNANRGQRLPADEMAFDADGRVIAGHADDHVAKPGSLAAARVRSVQRMASTADRGARRARRRVARLVRNAGLRARLTPHPGFDAAWYLAHNPDVRASGMNAMDHYEQFGRAEGRRPGPWSADDEADAAPPPAVAMAATPSLGEAASPPEAGVSRRLRAARSDRAAGRVFLHVGTHKTGTTAFQSYVAEWRAQLLRDHDIYVHPGMFARSHFEVPALVIRPELLTADRWLLDGHHGFVATEDEMRAAIRRTVEQPAPNVLFSAEGLSFLRTPAEVDALTELFWPRRIEPIVVLRDPAAFLRAYRTTHEAMGMPLSSDPASTGYVGSDSWLIDYPSLVATLRQLADGGPVRVIDYDREVATEGSIIPAIAVAMGLTRKDLYLGSDRQMNLSNPTRERIADGRRSTH